MWRCEVPRHSSLYSELDQCIVLEPVSVVCDRAAKRCREGCLKPRVDRIFRHEDDAEAHRLLDNRQTIGKLILRMDT